MKETIRQIPIYLGLIAVVVAVLVWVGNSSGPKKPTAAINGNSSSVLTLKESKYDFGTVSMAKGKVSKEFALENKSQGDVKISEVFTSCMCTEAELKVGGRTAGPFGMQGHTASNANLIVKPGEEMIVKVIFDPAAHGPAGVGPIERQVVVYTSAGKDPIVLEFKAVVTP